MRGRNFSGRRRHLAFEEVGSTNTLALEAARAGDPGPLWITAARQTQGRGRRGRSWDSRPGNLYASLLLIDPAPLDRLSTLPLVVALGACEGVARLPGIEPDRVRIKWPNDVLVGGAKCIGILIETERLPEGGQAVVVGCGANVEVVPEDVPYPVTGLRREGATGLLPDIFDCLAGGIESNLRVWAAGEGFPQIREGWLRRAVGLGEPCRVNLPHRSVEGVFKELDAGGRLVLQSDDGAVQSFAAGDVFLLGPGALLSN